ncbi:MAG: N-acetylmuramoyl-L-alanine amidase [Victivallaceae bacterium]|nr:N-acetylmuramoyl-L-alanine amidase [Victivallaceae bacterium]
MKKGRERERGATGLLSVQYLLTPMILLLLFAGASGLAAPAKSALWPARTSIAQGRTYISLRDTAKYFNFQFQEDASNVRLTGSFHRFLFQPDKRQFRFNGMLLYLTHAPFSRGDLFLSMTDRNTVLAPLLRRNALNKHPLGRILLDPGHGGKDTGAQGRLYREKELTLKIARRTAELLRAKGYAVTLTRNTDSTVGLNERAAAIRRTKSDLFVSIHLNATVNKLIHGIETYCLTPAGGASSNAGKPDARSYPGNRFDTNNFALAYLVQRSMLHQLGTVDRGVRHARFLVLREATTPGILVECGYLSNYSEERKLGSPAYIERIARALVDGIGNYHKSLRR